jgi:hypothetical protein
MLLKYYEKHGDKKKRSFVATVRQLASRLLVLGEPFLDWYIDKKDWVTECSNELKDLVHINSTQQVEASIYEKILNDRRNRKKK